MKAHNPTKGMGDSARAGVRRQIGLPGRILVVEEEPDIRRLDTEVLRESGYQVDSVESGFLALNTFKINHYDLLIIEEELSMMTGLELIEAMRSQDVKVPIILISGVKGPNESTTNPRPHVQAFLVKPYTVAELLQTVGELLLAPATVSTGGSPQLRLPRL